MDFGLIVSMFLTLLTLLESRVPTQTLRNDEYRDMVLFRHYYLLYGVEYSQVSALVVKCDSTMWANLVGSQSQDTVSF